MRRIILISVLCIGLTGCGGDDGGDTPFSPSPPTPPPQAEISIASNVNPIVFVWNVLTLQYETAYTITVSETNGVGCNISTVESAFYLNGQTYTPATLQGGRLNANSSLSFNFVGWVALSIYPQIRVLVSGSDDNGYTISKSQLFNLAYY